MCRIFQFNFNFLKKTFVIKLSFIVFLSFYFYEIKFFLKLRELNNLYFFCIVLQSVLNEFYVVVDKVVYRCFVELIEGIVISISKLCFI